MGGSAVPQGSPRADDEALERQRGRRKPVMLHGGRAQQEFHGDERWPATRNPRRAIEVQARRASLLDPREGP